MAAVVATSGPATEPRELLNAKTELQGVGVAVTSEMHVCAVERALQFVVDSADWTYFVWGESSAQSLAPAGGRTRVWAHNRSDVCRR